MTSPAADPVGAYLAQVRADWDHIGAKPVRHIPALAAALEAVLARHQPIVRPGWWVTTCDYDDHHWPCPEYQDITEKLASESAQGGDQGGDQV